MQALVITQRPQIGELSQALELVTMETPEPRKNEVLVRVLFTTINVDDINLAEGTALGGIPIGTSPSAQKPVIPGIEYSGIAEKIHSDIQRLDKTLQREYPDYTNLVSPPPLSIKQVQSLLQGDETMLVYLFGKDKGFLWVISRNSADLVQLEISENELERQVRRLRRKMVPRGVVEL